MSRLLAVFLLIIFLPIPAIGAVIFSDDFEWGSDWNSSQGDTAPVANGWAGILMSNRGGSYEAAYVNATGAKQGVRGFIQYWDQESGYSDAQNIFLNTAGLVFPDEYYVGYWMRVDPNWDWGSVDSMKIIKTNLALGTWDIAWKTEGSIIAYCRGDGADGGVDDWCYVGGLYWTGDTNPLASISTDEAGYTVLGNWSEIDGGEWHYFIWHFDHANNILELSVDGANAFQMSSDPFPGNGIFGSGVTTERWNFGGNITNGGGGVDEMWTAYDDLIIATTQAEVLEFLGVGDPTPTPGECGTADGVSTATEPTENLCAEGTAGDVSLSGGNWVWICEGINSETDDSCSAPYDAPSTGSIYPYKSAAGVIWAAPAP